MVSPEFAIIELLRERCAVRADDVRCGIGDDAAVTAVPSGMELVTATDTLIEGTHFPPGTSATAIGHKALAINLSDLAAMGAAPRWASIALALPDADLRWVAGFADGFATLAQAHGVILIGGDTVRGPLSVTLTLQGLVPVGQAVRRDGARPGDVLLLTGEPGRAAAGCRARLGLTDLPADGNAYLDAFDYPQPRVELGQALRGLASAMIDISDGVHTDIERLLAQSGCGADLELPPLPWLEGDFDAVTARELFLCGGEDYELCFATRKEHSAAAEQIAAAACVPLHCVGTVTAQGGVRWRANGQDVVPGGGFEHFGASS